MGLSFHDQDSFVEASIGSLRFRSATPNPIPRIGSNGITSGHEESEDDINIQYGVQMVAR